MRWRTGMIMRFVLTAVRCFCCIRVYTMTYGNVLIKQYLNNKIYFDLTSHFLKQYPKTTITLNGFPVADITRTGTVLVNRKPAET